jgi:hypothetical protein
MKIDNNAQNSSLIDENVKVNHDDAWLAIKRLRGYTLDSNTNSYEVINIFPEQQSLEGSRLVSPNLP